MANVNDTVREAILCYPSLHSNRSDVLHFLLCVAGNGFYWGGNGEPVSRTPEDRIRWTPERQVANSLKLISDDAQPLIREILIETAEKRVEGLQKIVDEVDIRVDLVEPIRNFYPQSEYALLMNVPDNVTAEWAEECEKMKTLAEKNGWTF